VLGIGGAPEGVITAAAMKCLGGEIQARLTALDDGQRQRLSALGYDDLDKIYQTEDLAPGEQILFSCTGITDGELLHGVRLFGGSVRTSTLYLSHTRRILRFVDTIHRQRLDSPVHF
jgi:fructose-1,6-bisphosphatase II